ncbi:hypothetical protein [Marinicella litoralis]|uniref:Secreted protein n=1 Tax=Marinicella litoralis TaxID=644220 RepID=A0A4R6XG26_9GAMM|nr:hypothetical protein [Marinicella litoralis]TDR18346.1 hypothetical protein C8D91_2263 [Marinicella litoralis]
MKAILMGLGLVVSGVCSAHDDSAAVTMNDLIHHETIVCDSKEGCEVICKQPGDRWNSYLKTEGNIEVTYFLTSGVRQLKADVGNGEFTILDTHPELQSCRITGVKS